MHDYDWQLLTDKLNAFEEKLKKLESDVFILNRYVDTQLNNKYYPNQNVDHGYWVVPTKTQPCMYDNIDSNQAMGMVCSCPKHSVYALSQGSLTDSGLPQTWKLSTTKEDYEE